MARKKLNYARERFEALTRPAPAAIPPAIIRAQQARQEVQETPSEKE